MKKSTASDNWKPNSQQSENCNSAMVSVVIPTYNCGDYIEETLKSVLDQDYSRLEIIIVDDGSTDRTRDVVTAFDSARVTYLYQSNSGGPSGPRNIGIQRARGRYIAFIDADDIMLPGKLKRAVQLLDREPTLGLVFANFVKFDELNEQHPGTFLDSYEYFLSLPKKKIDDSQYIIKAEAAYDGLLSENYIGTSGVVVPKEVLQCVGPFDEGLEGAEDYDMWLRITSAYNIGFIDMIGHRYRMRTNSITSKGDEKLVPHSIAVMRKQLEKHLSDTALKKVRRRLSRHLFALGYCYQLTEKFTLARKYYLLSLREAHYWLSWKGLFVTLFGVHLVRFLKNVRGN